jgi:hypothetical protein
VTRRRAWSRSLIAPGLYGLLAVVLFWSAWRDPHRVAIGNGHDSSAFTWFHNWTFYAVTHGQNPLLTTHIDYPYGVNLGWNALMPLVGMVAGPIALLIGPVASYNLVATSALAASAWCAYLALRRLVRSRVAALIGGLVYGFSPYMVAQSLGHPHVTVAFIPPLLLIILDELVVRQAKRAWVVGMQLGLALAVQFFIGEEVLATSVLVAGCGVLLLAALYPREVSSRLGYVLRAGGLAAGILLVAASGPILVQFFGPQRIHAVLQAQNVYVNDVLSFIVPTRLQALVPHGALRISDRFTGGLPEQDAYFGIPLLLLLSWVSVRNWGLPLVRFATLLAAVVGIWSLGPTLHIGGRVTHIPSFVLALVFPALGRFLPGRFMLYASAAGWLLLLRGPVLASAQPGRMALYLFLLAALLLAVFVDRLAEVRNRGRLLGAGLAVTLALVPLLPGWPAESSPKPIPAFFTDGEVDQLPSGSVVLVAPFAHANEATAELWQAAAGMRFKMPEGFAFIPAPNEQGLTVDPLPSPTQTAMLSIQEGGATVYVSNELRQKITKDLSNWQVRAVIVGPMPNQELMINFFTAVLARPPVSTGGVFVWWQGR